MGTHYSEPIFKIDNTEIKIATGSYGNESSGKSQTVNVFDHNHIEGSYQAVYRILSEENYVSAEVIKLKARNLHELDHYLVKTVGAIKETP